MSPGRIAAIVTCRDLGRTLDEAVRSVEGQTRPAAEVVVVDDGSEDLFTRQSVERLQRQGTRVVRGPGAGASTARNLGARVTHAEYLVWLDADDVLDPGYFQAAAGRLDADPDLDFVSCAITAFGAASYTWSPSEPTFVEAVGTGGVPHASTMVRRSVWEAAGGFDEALPSFELLDFWAGAIARGARGLVLPEPFLKYRVRPGSGYRRSLEPETFRARLRHFYAKHGDAVAQHADQLLLRKEAFLLEQRRHRDHLETRVRDLEAELAALQAEIRTLGARAVDQGLPRVAFGDLRRIDPLSRQWGRDRGTPVDRRYIEAFLARHRADIRGRVLEVEEARYTRQFGEGVTQADVIDREPANPRATIVADLRDAGGLAADAYDCIILTQTLHLIDDMPAALRTCARLLRPGGVLLVTAPSVIRVDDRAGPDGDYWRLTEASARRLFAEVFPLDGFEVETRGNVLACAAFLYGLSAEELTDAELNADDPAFPLIVAIRAVKPGSPARATVRSTATQRVSPAGAAVVLTYHRIADLTPDTHRLCTAPDVFRAQLHALLEDFTPMALPDLVRAAASGCLPDRALAVTLDDGYLDALTTAAPILSELGIPATFFVTSDRLDERHERDWDRLERVLLSDRAVPDELAVAQGSVRLRAATRTPAERAAALESLHRAMWPLDSAARRAVVQAVESWCGARLEPRDSHRVLTGDEIRRLAATPGHAIGSHTVHHLALTTHSSEVKRREIADDRRALETRLGQPVTLFSYPYGEADADTAAIVAAAGFHAAFTVEAGLVRPGANRLFLPRVEPAADAPGDLHARLDELFRSR